MKKKNFSADLIKLGVCLLVWTGTAFTQITGVTNNTMGGSTPAGGLSVSLKNETNSRWTMGGVRFRNNGGTLPQSIPPFASQWDIPTAVVPRPDIGANYWDIYKISRAMPQNAKLLPNRTTAVHSFNWGVGSTAAHGIDTSTFEILLRTGGAGVPNNPPEAEPITIEELRELIKDPLFYDHNYRTRKPDGMGGWEIYYDSLGANGGRFGGGLMNTYLGETQLHFAIPRNRQFYTNGAWQTIIQGDQAPFYYMTLALGQEIFRVDAKLMFAMGAKESNSGTTLTPWSTNIFKNDFPGQGQNGTEFGNWHVEPDTYGDRVLNYANLFPKYEAEISTFGEAWPNPSGWPNMQRPGGWQDFFQYYTGTTMYQRESTRHINALVASIAVQYTNYDVMAHALDICWMYALEHSADRYLGLAMMLVYYNRGENSLEGIKTMLGNANIDQVVNSSNPFNEFPFAQGFGNYRDQILGSIQVFVDASRDFQLGGATNSELIDFEITLTQLREIFFGKGATNHQTQGDGGLLLHFYDPQDQSRDQNTIQEMRKKIWDNLGEAFAILDVAGTNAGVSSAGTISYRYDFLSAVRTVKAYLPFEKKFTAGGDAARLIPKFSTQPCTREAGDTSDERYPYANTTRIVPDEDACLVYVFMRDDRLNKRVRWTVDASWNTWELAEMIEVKATDENNFKFEVSREMAELFNGAQSKHDIWIMAEDNAGNSVVIRREIRFEREFRPPEIQSAAVFETSNPAVGNPNLLKAAITRNDFTDLKNSNNVTYSWRWNTPTSPIQQIPATAISTSQNGDTLLANISSNFGWGEGLLIMEFDSLGVNGNPTGVRMTRTRAIEDKVGPAIRRNSVTLRPSDGNSGQFDTLIVEFSEAVKADGVNLLAFKNTAVDSTTIAVAVPHNETTGTTRTFFFPSGSLANNNTPLYDSVKIRFPNPSADDGGIFDIPGIYPLPHNQWVGINPVGRFKHPTISWAGVFEDRNPAVGNTNLLKAVGVLGDTENGRRGFSWSWNGNNENISINREDGDTLFFNVGSFVGSGTGTLTMTYQEKLEDDSWVNAEPITRQIEDRVGPAIITGGARLHVNNGEIGQFDTLILTFSEEIRTFDYPYISLFFSTDASGSNPVAQTTVSTEGRQMFLFAPGQITQDGNLIYSWVKLNRVEATCNGMIPACYKAVYDNAHNPPHENNQWVEIEFFGKFRAPIMISAEVRDEIGDGTANVIVAQITPRDVENLENAKYFYRWNTQTPESSRREPTSVSANGSTLRTNIPADLGFGLGWLIMEYDTLAGATPWRDSIPLLDKVGPAIKKDGADFFPNNGNSGQFDTLLVEFTEGVVVNGDCALLAFATNDQGANETPVLPHNVIYQGNGVWVFIYNPNSLTTDNKLKFSHVKAGNQVISGERGCTPVLDSESNFPHENSIWVAIKDNTKSTRLPINISAAIFDNRGEQAGRRDGKGDSIFVQFTLAETQVINGVTIPPFTAQMIDSVRIVFAGNTTMAQKNEINVHSNTSFSYTRRNDFPGSGTGTIEIFFTDRITDINGKIEFTRPATINDKVAPVIDSASYVRYDDRPDTLKVWFSEPLSSTGNSPIDAISGRHNLVAVPHLSNGNFAVYVVSNGNFVYGDSIWIAANSGIRDLAHNEQENENNKRVEIKYLRFITLNIESAAYFDTSYPRDGYIDSINVRFGLATSDGQFAETIRQIVMANEFELPRNRHFTKNNATVNMANGSIGIRVSQNRGSVPVPVTSVSSTDDVITVTTPQIRNAGDTLRILLSSGRQIDDSIAPVITAAHFAPMFMKDDDDVIVDTLIVRFSERVTGHVAKEMLRAFKFSTDAEYVIDFEDRNVNSDVAHFLLRTNEATVLPEEGDSIRIESGISDGRNLQNVKTVWVPITIGKTTYVYNLTIYPNPYNPGNFSYKNPITDKNNMAVLVRPRGSRKITGELSGSIVILDQLGNKIIDNESFEFRREEGILIWTWDGKNTRGRNVGAGFYQAIIQITNANAKEGEKDTQVYLRKIGIRN